MDEREDNTRLMSVDYSARNLSGFLNSVTAKIYNSDVNHQMDNKNRPFSDTVVAISDIHAINQVDDWQQVSIYQKVALQPVLITKTSKKTDSGIKI
ncbi:MAG: hypothetical protein R2764_01815 [Bacteroidales bacterium]